MHTLTRFLLLTALIPIACSAALESWTSPDGQPTQAEFVRRNGDYLTFQRPNGGRYLLPYVKLTDAERARIDVLTGHPAGATTATPAPAAKAPAEVAASTPTTPPAEPPPSPPAVEPVATKPGKVLAPLINQLVYLKGSSLQPLPTASLAGIRYVAVYYSAHWCPPCRAFTPKLVAAYKEIKAAHPEFELIFVSNDHDEDAMKTYMRETSMAWPALRFGQNASARTLQRPNYENGIPNLVFMTADGKELATTFTTGGDYSGPGKVLAEIQRQFKM